MKNLIFALLISFSSFAQKTVGKIISLDPDFDKLVDTSEPITVIAEGYEWSEGPVWIRDGDYLLFSDVPKNTIYKWKNSETTVFLSPSGYTGIGRYSNEPGSNGLAVSKDGQFLLLCEHGDRRISKMPLKGLGGKITLADKCNGKRFNSPNDLVEAKNGNIYFTDPPYGLPQYEKDNSRETPLFGVYMIDNSGKTHLIVLDLIRPNGVALSPDQKTLYVAQSDQKAYIMAYPILPNGLVGKGKLFFDASYLNKEGLKGGPDGLKVDQNGNIFSSGPGGVIILNAKGKLLGRIETGQATSNVGWGEDGSTLFITADMYVLRLKTKTKGTGF
jgi:gluconolactonase